MRVGFIGTGNIGRPMAEHIARSGFELVVHDLREEAAAPLIEMGATWAATPASVADQCELVATCLPGPPEMEAVVFGDDGVARGIRPGAVYVDHTTNSPQLVRRAHDAIRGMGAEMLDAPVSGGVEGAESRDLTVLVGGESETLARCREVLNAVAKTVLHVGGIGAGCVTKITHNCASFVRNMALMECLTLGVKAGVEPDVLLDAFRRSALGTNMDLNVRLPDTIFQGDFDPRFALKLARKDIGLATDLADLHQVPLRLAQLCQGEMDDAMARGQGELDSSAFLTLQEERAGVQIRV